MGANALTYVRRAQPEILADTPLTVAYLTYQRFNGRLRVNAHVIIMTTCLGQWSALQAIQHQPVLPLPHDHKRIHVQPRACS